MLVADIAVMQGQSEALLSEILSFFRFCYKCIYVYVTDTSFQNVTQWILKY